MYMLLNDDLLLSFQFKACQLIELFPICFVLHLVLVDRLLDLTSLQNKTKEKETYLIGSRVRSLLANF